MRGNRSPSWASVFLLCLAFSWAATLSAEEAAPDLSRMSTAELASKAYEIWARLDPGLREQSKDWEALKNENATLREDLQKTLEELAPLKAELEKRSNDSMASAKELSEARAALKKIASLVGGSAESWQSSTDAVDKALKDAAKDLGKAKTEALIWKGIATAATIWAIVKTIK